MLHSVEPSVICQGVLRSWYLTSQEQRHQISKAFIISLKRQNMRTEPSSQERDTRHRTLTQRPSTHTTKTFKHEACTRHARRHTQDSRAPRLDRQTQTRSWLFPRGCAGDLQTKSRGIKTPRGTRSRWPYTSSRIVAPRHREAQLGRWESGSPQKPGAKRHGWALAAYTSQESTYKLRPETEARALKD